MAIKSWDTKTYRMLYRRFEAGESLIEGLESLALSEGIREAAVTSCIGSLSQLKLRNLCDRKEGVPEFERQIINENLELVSAGLRSTPGGWWNTRTYTRRRCTTFRRNGRRSLRRRYMLYRRIHVSPNHRRKYRELKRSA